MYIVLNNNQGQSTIYIEEMSCDISDVKKYFAIDLINFCADIVISWVL